MQKNLNPAVTWTPGNMHCMHAHNISNTQLNYENLLLENFSYSILSEDIELYKIMNNFELRKLYE